MNPLFLNNSIFRYLAVPGMGDPGRWRVVGRVRSGGLLTLLMVLLLAGRSQAQSSKLYWVQSSGTATNDQLNVADFNGSNKQTLISGNSATTFVNPQALWVDAANNVAYVGDGANGSSTGISRFNATTGASLGTIVAGSASMAINGLQVVGSKLYWVQSSGTATDDQLNVANLDGSNKQTLASGNSATTFANPQSLWVDAANNVVYVGDGANGGSTGISRFNATTGASLGTIVAGSASTAINGLQVVGSKLYWVQSSSTATDDQLNVANLDGSGRVSLAAGAGSFDNPQSLWVDAVNSAIFVGDGANSATTGITRYTLTGGSRTIVLAGTAGVSTNSLTFPQANTATTPTVATAAANSIATTSATLGGTVTADGGATVTERGVVYSTSNATPTTADTKVANGSGTGGFSQSVTGLAAGTTYYVRAYAINSAGTSYGTAQTFMTTAAPTTVVSLNRATGSPRASAQATYTLIFAAPITGLTASNFSITTAGLGGTSNIDGITNPLGDNTTYNVTVNAGTGNGTLTLSLSNSTGLSPAVSNVPFQGQTFTFDRTAPMVTISTTATSPTSTAPIPVTVTFTEPVFNFSSDDVMVSNGTLLAFSGSGTTYSLSVTPATAGTVTVNLAANVAQDAVGNGNIAASQFSINYTLPVTPAPVVTVPANGSTVHTTTPNYAGTAPAASTVTVYLDNTAIGTTLASDAGTFSLNQPTALSQGSHAVRATAQLSGQSASASSSTNTFTVDTVQPTVSISSSATSPTSTSPIPVTVTFSESVSGFDATDLTVGNGTQSNFSGSATSYSFTVTPTADGPVTVDIAANVAQDQAGNGNTAATQLRIQYVVLVVPTVATTTPGNITTSSATLGGSVTAEGGTTVTERGVVYLQGNGAPSTADTKVVIGSGTGSFSQTITGLAANTTYSVRAYATNSVGSSYGATQSFTTTAALATTSSQTNLNCNGDSNGAATVNVSGGTAPYSFAWTRTAPTTGSVTATSGTANSSTIEGLTAGTYSVTVTDAVNATTTRNFTLTAPAALVVAPTSQTNITCNGGSNAAAAINVSGGTGAYTYDWSPDNPTGDGTNAVSGLSAGTYSVLVTDANGCTQTASFTITQPAALTATTSQANVTTNGGVNGSATITVSGGTPAYSYDWSPNVSTTATATNLAAGSYSVTVTDANGCTISRTFSITQPAATTPAPVVTVPANGSTVHTTTPNYAGTAPAASTVTVYLDNTAIGTTLASDAGTFSLNQPTALSQGSHAVHATAQLSGQSASASSSTNTFTVDTVQPTVSISSSATSPTSTSPIPVTVTFSESVSGFDATDLTVGNGTQSNFSGSATSYSFTVTPTADGPVTVDIAANVAQDQAGNGNTAATQLRIQYAAPVTATTWTGALSTDWFTAANWTHGVPSSTRDATIPAAAAHYPRLSTGTANAKALTLASGATLSQSGGTLALAGNFSNSGTFSATGGLVNLTGSASQTLGGPSRTAFCNLTVGAAGARLSGAADVQRLLTLTGSLTTNGQDLRLLSDAGGTAMVVNNASATLIGNATMQRYIDPSLNPGPGYRHYASPVQATSVADLATSGFAPVVNPAYNTAAAPGATTPFPTVFGYDEARLTNASALTSAFEFGYFSPAALTDPLTPGRGYTVNISASEKVDFTGTLNSGTVPVGALSRGTQANAGWQLLGNPYPAPLDWKVARTGLPAGVIDAIYVYKSDSQYQGSYQVYQNGVGTLPDGLIPAMQGFLLRVSQNVPSFSFQNSWRSTSYQDPTFNRPAAETRPAVQLDLVDAKGHHEPAFVYFEAGATTGRDDHYDAEKLPNTTGLNLASVAATGEQLAINGLPVLSQELVSVPLTVQVPTTGSYTLRAASLRNLASTAVYLHDAQTDRQVDLRQQGSYAFTASSAALLTTRFSLRFSSLGPLANAKGLMAGNVRVFPNPARTSFTLQVPAVSGASQAHVTLYSVLGQSLRDITLALPAAGAQTTLDVRDLPSGVYVLRVRAGGSSLSQRVVVE